MLEQEKDRVLRAYENLAAAQLEREAATRDLLVSAQEKFKIGGVYTVIEGQSVVAMRLEAIQARRDGVRLQGHKLREGSFEGFGRYISVSPEEVLEAVKGGEK